jgi:hypothetical protein
MEEKKESKSSNELLEDRFTKERIYWKRQVTDISGKMKDLRNIPEIEVSAFSQRQIALEYTHFLMEQVSKVNAHLRKLKKERFLFYTNGYDIKLDKAPREMFILVDLEKSVIKKEFLDNHLSYMRASVDSLDKIIWGIKWRLTFEGFIRDKDK